MNEIVYILINEAMPRYVKIGITTDLKQRLKSLYRTPVPLPFECFYACTVKNSREIEAWLFDIFEDRRVSKEREFFEIAPERVVAALRDKALEDVTPQKTYVETKEDELALDKARSRRDRFNFALASIPIGSELTFSRDSAVRARVIDNTSIEYNGQIRSLSESAKEILNYRKSPAGTLYWMYEGETLDERRRKLEDL